MIYISNNRRKKNFRAILNFLFLFLIVIDPTRNIFHLTEVVFFLLLLMNLSKFNGKNFIFFVFCLASYFLALSFAITNQAFDKAREISLLINYVYILYMMINTKEFASFRAFYKIIKLMSLIVLFLALFFFFNKGIAYFFINFFRDSTSTIMFSESRAFLNMSIISVFYKTSPMVTLVLPYSFSKWFETKEKRYLIDTIIFTSNLLFSGTRANILSALLILAFVYLNNLFFRKRSMVLFPILFCTGLFFAGLLIFLMLTQKGEASLDVKSLHIQSTMELFFSSPFRTLFVGFGPGSLFYSAGFKRMTSQTELSYLEVFRNFGVINGFVIICFFFQQLIVMYNNKLIGNFLKNNLCIGYLAYLFIAGTNPFLNSATGFITAAMFFYMGSYDIREEI